MMTHITVRTIVSKRNRTLAALGMANFVDQAEALALPILFPAIMATWGLSEVHLGAISSVRNFLQTVGSPLWGYAADRFSRKSVLVTGAGLWGVWTMLCGLVTNYHQLLIVRAMSGLGLACLMPGAFSLIADHYAPEERGKALGVLGFLGTLGVVGGVLALGWIVQVPTLGWRWGFILLGLASVASGLGLALFVEEPPRGAGEPELAGWITDEMAQRFSVRPTDLKRILRVPTMWAVLLQGVPGAMPWVVLGTMMVTWMMTARALSYTQATGVLAALVMGAAVGSVLGGFLGDAMARRSRRYGRIVLAQISVFSGVPLTYLIFTLPLSFAQFFALSAVTAVVITWAGTGARDPIISEVIPPELRGSAYALSSLVEGGISAGGPFIAGLLAQRYDLTRALLLTVPTPWLICSLIWLLFYHTYPRDAARLREQMLQRRKTL